MEQKHSVDKKCRSNSVLDDTLTLLFTPQGQQSHRLVIFAAIFVLMTLLILYGSNNVNDNIYSPLHLALNKAIKATDLKKWSGKDGYVPFHGNKVLNSSCTDKEMCFMTWKSTISIREECKRREMLLLHGACSKLRKSVKIQKGCGALFQKDAQTS